MHFVSGMALFLKNVSFHGIDLEMLIGGLEEVAEDRVEMTHILKKGLADRVVKPLNTIVYNHDEAEQAFRYMASGRHMGKVVLKV